MRAAESGAARSFLFSFPRPPTLSPGPPFFFFILPPSRSPSISQSPPVSRNTTRLLLPSFFPSFPSVPLLSLSLSRADLGVPEFSRSPFIPISLFLSKLFLLSRGFSLLPSASPASSIGVSRNWRDMLSRSFVLRSTRRRNGACRRWTLSLSLSALRPSSSRPPRCSRLARLPLFPSISNYGFPRIARTIFSPIPVKGEGNGKTWRANSALLGIELSRLRSISNGGSPDFFPPSILLLPSLRHFYDDFPVNRNLPRLELFLLLLLLLLFPSTLKPFVTRCICFA